MTALFTPHKSPVIPLKTKAQAALPVLRDTKYSSMVKSHTGRDPKCNHVLTTVCLSND